MQLAIDIGNTNTKIGLFDQDRLVALYNNGEMLSDILDHHPTIRYAIIARSGRDGLVEEKLALSGISTLQMKDQLQLPLQINYKTPHTLGADRIAGSTAAAALFPGMPVLKIDTGTCVTYDFIDPDGRFVGGAISPGLHLRFKALHEYTARLPLIQVQESVTSPLIGQDTASAITSGVMNGIAAEVSGIIKQYAKRFNGLKVVATGGDWPKFATMQESEIFARPNLVLEGLNQILNFNLRSEK